MSFEDFKGISYHTRLHIRIPGTTTKIDKSQLFTKGKYDFDKQNSILREVYEQENFANK
jgi:hypothetical protein